MSIDTAPRVSAADYAELRQLNAGYIRAFLEEDAGWYDAHIADDFICVRTDGSVVNRADFLAATKPGSAAAEYSLADVVVRIHGESAYVTALGSWRRHDGSTGQTRYIDAYAKIDGEWKVVSAQLTKVSS
jgi:ketosteroid isomerase-like protein